MKKLLLLFVLIFIISSSCHTASEKRNTATEDSLNKRDPNSFDPDKEKLIDSLTMLMSACPHDEILSDTIKKGIWNLRLPKKNGDVLLSLVIDNIFNTTKSQADYFNEYRTEREAVANNLHLHHKVDPEFVNMDYEVEMYAKEKIISILATVDLHCYIPTNKKSLDAGYITYNYMQYQNHIYEITLKENQPDLDSIVNAAIHEQYDSDCINNDTLHSNYDLFINEHLWVPNPYFRNICIDPVRLTGAMKYVQFTRVN